MKLSILARRVGGQVEGCCADVEIRGVAPIAEAQPGQIAHVGNSAERAAVKRSLASALITPPGLKVSAVPRLCGDGSISAICPCG